MGPRSGAGRARDPSFFQSLFGRRWVKKACMHTQEAVVHPVHAPHARGPGRQEAAHCAQGERTPSLMRSSSCFQTVPWPACAYLPRPPASLACAAPPAGHGAGRRACAGSGRRAAKARPYAAELRVHPGADHRWLHAGAPRPQRRGPGAPAWRPACATQASTAAYTARRLRPFSPQLLAGSWLLSRGPGGAMPAEGSSTVPCRSHDVPALAHRCCRRCQRMAQAPPSPPWTSRWWP